MPTDAPPVLAQLNLVVEDPDGNPVGLRSPIDDDRRSTPPSM